MSIRTFALATSFAAGLALAPVGIAGASSDGETTRTVLDQFCEARGGLPVWSPYAMARCQNARINKGFETERLICEDLADGRFVVSPSATHMNRASWSCIATSPLG